MVADAEFQPPLCRGGHEHSAEVFFGSLVDAVPWRKVCAVHEECFMVGGHVREIFGARFYNHIDICIGIEIFGMEQGNEILVSECGGTSIVGNVPGIKGRTRPDVVFVVHSPAIPFRAIARD